MGKYYIVEPEVAGGWGDHTEFTRVPGKPVTIDKLHYRFDGWFGDDLLESTPCYIATEQLAAAIIHSHLSGVEFRTVEISKSSQFEDLYPNRDLPKFLWLKPTGDPSKDDFGLTSDLQLVVSERALAILKGFSFSHAAADLRE